LFFVVDTQAFSIRNTEGLVVSAQKAFFSNNIGLLLSIHKPFLVEMELRVVHHPIFFKKKTMFWGLLGFRHVQTSLENIVFLVSLGF